VFLLLVGCVLEIHSEKKKYPPPSVSDRRIRRRSCFIKKSIVGDVTNLVVFVEEIGDIRVMCKVRRLGDENGQFRLNRASKV
jgi:hypothetical protein